MKDCIALFDWKGYFQTDLPFGDFFYMNGKDRGDDVGCTSSLFGNA
jgi:hypothetical protein